VDNPADIQFRTTGREHGMSGELESSAFKMAVQRSERIRIIGLLGITTVLLLVVIIRSILAAGKLDQLALIQDSALLVFILLYETFMLLFVGKAIRAERILPTRTWIVNILIETSFPTVGLIVITLSTDMGPYRSLVAPVVLVYFLFLIFSTLRLSPFLSYLTGGLATLGYLLVTYYTFATQTKPALNSPLFSLEVYLTNAVIILLGGFAAGAVADKIRRHVETALMEAEARQKVEDDLKIARSIQQGLLPRQSPGIEGFEIAGWNKPADETGGDYYDWQVLPDGKIGVSLADVMGHGIGPALIAAACRAYTRSGLPADKDLGAVMTRSHNLLMEDLKVGTLVTMAVAVLDPGEGKVQLLSAGHGPLLLYTKADDRITQFDAHGIPYGVIPGVSYGPPQEIMMASGDMLILITDGFHEWADRNDEEFGIPRLCDTIRGAHSLSAKALIERLYAVVTDFVSGSRQMDDLTAVILKRS